MLIDADHFKIIKEGGAPRTRSKKKVTEPGPLASLADVRLVDLDSERIEAWATFFDDWIKRFNETGSIFIFKLWNREYCRYLYAARQ